MSSTSWTDVTNYIKTQLKPGVLGHTDVQKILNSILAVINQINAGDFTPTPESLWKADVTYPANTTPVLWQDKWLVSNTANNLGNVPISTAGVVHPTWRVISASTGSGLDEWEAKVYPNTLEIVFVDGALYYLDREEVGDSPYVSVDFADELLEGVWVSLGGSAPPHNSLQGLNQGDYQHLTALELATLQGITRSLDEMGALIRYNFPSKVSGSAGVDANDFVTMGQVNNFVTLDTTQTITGFKTFNGNLTLGPLSSLRITQNNGFVYPGEGVSAIDAFNQQIIFAVGLPAIDGASQWKSFFFNPYLLTNNTTRAYVLPDASGTLALLSDIGVSSQWGTNGTSIFYNGGNVGIGTDSPSARLHTKSADLGTTAGSEQLVSRFSTYDGNNSSIDIKNIRFTSGSDHTSVESRILRRIDSTDGAYLSLKYNYLSLGHSSLDRLNIDLNGNIGIGTSSPVLSLAGTFGQTIYNTSNAGISLATGGGLNDYWLMSRNGSNGSLHFFNEGTTKIMITSSGNVLINQTVSTGERLQVTGDAKITGNVTATAFFATSDINLKKLTDTRYNAGGIDAISYKWKNRKLDTKNHVGYSAQQVAQFMPDAVTEGGDGNLSVNYIEVLVAKVAMLESKMKRHGLG